MYISSAPGSAAGSAAVVPLTLVSDTRLKSPAQSLHYTSMLAYIWSSILVLDS